jgi:Zn-dependent protease with chaperone function
LVRYEFNYLTFNASAGKLSYPKTPCFPIYTNALAEKPTEQTAKKVTCESCRSTNPSTRRFCRFCSSNLNPKYDLPTRLYQNSEAVAHLNRLVSFAPITKLVEAFLDRMGTPWVEAQLLGNAVRLGERQMPDLYEMAMECASVLGLVRLPRIYLTNNGAFFPDAQNPMVSLGTNEDPIVLVQFAVPARLSDQEFKFSIGREMGHVKCGHPQYTAVASLMSALAAGQLGAQLLGQMGSVAQTVIGGIIGSAIFDQPLAAALNAWYRSANYTADLAGLIAVRDIKVVERYFSEMICGWTGSSGLASRLNLDELIEQDDELEESEGRYSEFLGPLGDAIAGPLGIPVQFNPGYQMPFSIKRLRNLQEYFNSDSYRTAESIVSSFLGGNYSPEQDPKSSFCGYCGYKLTVPTGMCPNCHASL